MARLFAGTKVYSRSSPALRGGKLAASSPLHTPGELRLPYVELDGWEPVGTQVQMWISGMLRHPAKLKLAAIEGTQGRKGVRFLYSAEVRGLSSKIGYTWLEAELAPSALPVDDRRLLLIANI